MQKPEERLNVILRKAKNSPEITVNEYSNLDIVAKLNGWQALPFGSGKLTLTVCVIILSYIFCGNNIFDTSECFLDMPSDASKVFREPENCDICVNVTKIDKVLNISAQEFYEKFSKTGKPLVVSDGALKWPALKLFDFNFFKNLYKVVDVNRSSRRNCQFFPYKTEFKSLDEVFEMSEARSKLDPGEASWYVGWSNCNDNAGNILKQYYGKPYFLPNNSENIALTWIFMGGPGRGAHMHVDNVHYPSWQAQLSGRKLWRLAPPPECLYECSEVQVTVEPGEIIVVDTNRWYHQTFVLPGDISITIGSEFD